MAKTKDIQVNRFRVKFGGEHYGPGQEAGNIIYDMPAEMADALIAGSNGTVVEIPKREDAAAKKGKGAAAKLTGIDTGLGSVDPNETVKKGK